MKFGLMLPHVGPAASRDSLVGTAQMAEQLGYDSVWVFDRLLYPLQPRTPYPGSEDGKLPEFCNRVFEPLTVLTYLAAHTSTLRFGTGVLVSAFLLPVLLARMTATLDVLSGGRFICGLGMGWSEDEYEASGVPFDHKGPRFDEYLEVVKKVWTEETPSFNGKYYHLAKSVLEPRPAQSPHPPLWIGGDSDAAIRRAAALGTGWYASGYVAPEKLATSIAKLRQERDRAFTVAMWAPVGFTSQDTHMPLVGTPEHVQKGVHDLQAMGVDYVVLLPGMVAGADPQQDVRRFAETIMPAAVPR